MHTLSKRGRLEGIEPSFSVPQTDVLPLNDSRHTYCRRCAVKNHAHICALPQYTTQSKKCKTCITVTLQRMKTKTAACGSLHQVFTGSVLAPTYSRSEELPSALEGLTAGFGMEPGVPPPHEAPEHSLQTMHHHVKICDNASVCSCHNCQSLPETLVLTARRQYAIECHSAIIDYL